MEVPRLVELASGVDALYLSATANLPKDLLERLERARDLASAVRQPLPMQLGDVNFGMAPHGWGRYRYLLAGELGRIGFATSEHLPAVRVQPRAELLHAVGPAATVDGFAKLLGEVCEVTHLSVNRLDLFADWQYWGLDAACRDRFVCRAAASRTYEERGAFLGFAFGSRSSKTVSARIYDKTADVARTGADWWPDLWGERFTPGTPVHRVEFEFGRTGLTEFRLDSPAQVLGASADLWRYATEDWLTYRSPTHDATRSRWPVAPEWEQVQGSSFRQDLVGLEPVRAGRRNGSLRKLFPALVGYLAAFAAAVGAHEIEDTLDRLDAQLRNDEIARHVSFPDRIARRRQEVGLR